MNNQIEGRTRWMSVRFGQPYRGSFMHYGEYRNSMADLVECPFYDTSKIWDITDTEPGFLEKQVLKHYEELIVNKKYYPGAYGDWIVVMDFKIEQRKYAILKFIGQKSWWKPTLAADLGIFVKSRDKFYFVGIVRGSPPVKGTPALIGGIVDVGEIMESEIYTAIREAKEEAGLDIIYDGNWDDLKEDYMIDAINIQVKNLRNISPNDLLTPARIEYIATIKTPEIERLPNGLKRVYRISAYILYMEFNKIQLTKELIGKAFKAGDDAQKLYIQEISGCIELGKQLTPENAPNFGFPHHYDLFKKMILKIKNNYLS